MKIITVQQVEHIAAQLARAKLSHDEQNPDFAARFPHILENCLIMPFHKSSGQSLYPSLVSKASILFYLMIKGRPFESGNKRIAITVLLVFLFANDKWLKTGTQQFYNFTMWVDQSPAELKEQVLSGIELFIRTHLVNL